MLEFEDAAKFQESFMINFEVSYRDMFGNECKRELKEDGKNIAVTMENRQVRVPWSCDGHVIAYCPFSRSSWTSILTGCST